MTSKTKAFFFATLFFPSLCLGARITGGGSTTITSTTGGMLPGVTYYIQVRDTLQSGATFFVSSGSVAGTLSIVPSGLGTILLGADAGSEPGISFYPAGVTDSGNIHYYKGATTSEVGRIEGAGSTSGWAVSFSTNGVPASLPPRILVSDQNDGAKISLNSYSTTGGIIIQLASMTFVSGSNSPIFTWGNDGILALSSGAFHVRGATLAVNGVIYNWPTSDGSSGQALTTNGSKTLSFATISGGTGLASITTGYGLISSGLIVSLDPATTAYIQNRDTLQTNTTFYVSSGTVNGPFRVKSATFSVNGVDYNFPTSDGALGSIFTTNGSKGVSWATNVQSVNYVISGGGSALTTGSKGFLVVEFACTISNWTVVGDQSGSVVVDVKRATYTNFPTTASIIGGGNKPTLSSAQKNQAAPSSWTSTSLAAGDILEFNVDSAATVTRVTVSLKVTKT